MTPRPLEAQRTRGASPRREINAEYKPTIPVAAGCLINERGEVLIAQRPVGKIAAGKWEFPGGKIEAGETPREALERELREELGVHVTGARPLIRVRDEDRIGSSSSTPGACTRIPGSCIRTTRRRSHGRSPATCTDTICWRRISRSSPRCG